MAELSTLLARHRASFSPVLPQLTGANVVPLDFTAANPRLAHPERLRDTAFFTEVVAAMLAEQHASTGIGGYLETRVIYRRSPHFDAATEPRSLHLGVDVWVPAGTPVAAPLPARVHSLADNNNFGDYGPTLLLQHELEGVTFYSLYGHLTRTDLAGLHVGQAIAQGQVIAHVGPYPENGDWPPHLHFQLIADMQGRWGDFPGVAPPSEREYWAALCPDPMLILGR
ncbi:peptidoglycan DD-metalloendopeptidase family protein [Hymenobacter sp. HMF4947]|uniref:Peptidoglycan DD-metalloendopeptidase family protein n=1 Tax=Hymenobacter ginkgonis TaxID=2682976 RepID=A0A7K1TJ24_9BACT|nr:peptidoglycan DD-metalloendopeptidase family protein [Hymenobacter ginkgonis]MVN78372.1 peptidoglycan DD-metalloendopeptidase family protein [Hymenobacter ginkgonis]